MVRVTIIPKNHKLEIGQKNKVKWVCINNVSKANAENALTATRSKETKKY